MLPSPPQAKLSPLRLVELLEIQTRTYSLLGRSCQSEGTEERRLQPLTFKLFFDQLGLRLNIRHFKDWASVTIDQVRDLNGHTILKRFSGSLKSALKVRVLYSLIHLLQSVYPFAEWESVFHPSLSFDPYRHFLVDFEAQHGITNKEMWYTVTSKGIRRAGGHFVLTRFGSLEAALNVHSHHPVETHLLASLSRSFLDSLDVSKNSPNVLEKSRKSTNVFLMA